MGGWRPSQAGRCKGSIFGKVTALLNKKLDLVEWGEFNLKKLFGKSTRGRRLKSADRIGGQLPFVTAGETAEGVSAFIANDVTVFPSNTVTIDMFGSAKYRSYNYGADDHIAVVHTSHLSNEAAVFVASAINKSSNTGEFHYGRNFYAKDADDLNIELPVNASGEVDFDFMNWFISEIQNVNKRKVKEFLIASGLKQSTLTAAEQAALNNLENVSWSTFNLQSVLSWQKRIAEINPLHIESLSLSDKQKFPFYGQSTINNGVMKYLHLKEEVLNNKLSRPTILIHSNNQNTVYLETPFYLKDGHGATSVLQSEYLDKKNAQFLITSIRKVISRKFAYNNKATKIALKSTEISLPTKPDNTPDFEYMDEIISAIQKLVMKDVAAYFEIEV